MSFASPCCLPLVPVYVGFIVGGNATQRAPTRAPRFRQALAFVLGFTVVFVALWASIGLVGYALRDHVSLLRQVGGAVLVVMGLHVAGLISLPVAGRQAGAGAVHGPPAPAAPGRHRDRAAIVRMSAARLLFGVVFAAGWTPCIGPILSGIIGLASLRPSVGEGAILLWSYAAWARHPLHPRGARRRLPSAAASRWFARHDAVPYPSSPARCSSSSAS